jgi:hypothetical protein
MINDVIDSINNKLDGIRPDQLTLGLAQKVYRVNSDDSVEYMPGILKEDGDVIYAGIDDINSLLIYHKSNAGQFTYDQRAGFGDSRINIDTFSLSIIAAWDFRKIKLNDAEMSLLLRSRIPQEINFDKNIRSVVISPASVNLNSKQVFDSEYALKENYLLPLYIMFIQINYTVQFVYDPACIDKCISC